MFIAVAVGFAAGLTSLILNLLTRFAGPLLNAYSTETVLGLGALIAYLSLRPDYHRIFRRQSLADALESFHFGVLIHTPTQWLVKGLVSFALFLSTGVFGIEGAAFEVAYASNGLFSRFKTLLIEEKQVFVLGAIASSLSTSLGSPFGAALLALELIHAFESRVRAGAVLSVFVSFGVMSIGQISVSRVFDIPMQEFSAHGLSTFFINAAAVDFDFLKWSLISVGAFALGAALSLLASGITKLIKDFYELTVFHSRLSQIARPVLIAVSIAMLIAISRYSDISTESLWRDLALDKISAVSAGTYAFTFFSIFFFSLFLSGSFGFFQPILALGALLGYATAMFAFPQASALMTIAGSAALLSALLSAPLAASALVLEISHDIAFWWIATIAVFGAYLTSRFFGFSSIAKTFLSQHRLEIIEGRVAQVLQDITLTEATTKDIKSVALNASVETLRKAIHESLHSFIGVHNADGTFYGLLAIEQLTKGVRSALRQDASQAEIAALERIFDLRDLVRLSDSHLRTDQELTHALRLLQHNPCLAVVDLEGKLVGFLYENTINALYRQRITSTFLKSRTHH